jgi:hypothetical protein
MPGTGRGGSPKNFDALSLPLSVTPDKRMSVGGSKITCARWGDSR